MLFNKEELKRRVEAAGKIRRWYQYVPYAGVPRYHTHFDDGKTNPRSYGQGRWDFYIRLMMEQIAGELDCMNSTFCDVGCSAGLFLLRAWQEFHFSRLIGIEAANGGYEQLLITRDYYSQMPLVPYKVALGPLTETIADSDARQINMETFPIVDLTLMSCVHYHMQKEPLIEYLSTLAGKSMYLMVLTDERAGGVINASSKFFKEQIISSASDEWELMQELNTLPQWLTTLYEPPCKDLTIMLFKSRLLKRLLVKDCFEKQMSWHSERHANWHRFAEEFYTKVFPPFIDKVLAGDITPNNHKECLVYQWQRSGYHGSTPWGSDVASERTLSYINIASSIAEHGQEQPIGLQEHLDMVDPWDGWHRVAVMHHLGMKYIYGKDVVPECSDQT
jgi:hypothetical protein